MRRPVRGIVDNRILTAGQKTFLRNFVESDLTDIFRLTGGTALSAFYLEHRLSEDLDFFSFERVPLYSIEGFLKKLDFVKAVSFTKLFDRNIFTLSMKDGAPLKVEFACYPFENIERVERVDKLRLDGFLDITVNKLCAITDRLEAKDFVDLYFAIKRGRLSLKRLMGLAEEKCGIKGIGHILKSRLLAAPAGIDKINLMVDVSAREIEDNFRTAIKKMVSSELK